MNKCELIIEFIARTAVKLADYDKEKIAEYVQYFVDVIDEVPEFTTLCPQESVLIYSSSYFRALSIVEEEEGV